MEAMRGEGLSRHIGLKLLGSILNSLHHCWNQRLGLHNQPLKWRRREHSKDLFFAVRLRFGQLSDMTKPLSNNMVLSALELRPWSSLRGL